MSRHNSSSGYSRTDRVADQIQQEMARLVQQEVKDPRVAMVTISGVKVSRDFSFADIYVTSMNDLIEGEGSNAGDQQHRKELVEVLQNAAGFLRSELARVLKLRTTPKLRFHYDEVIERGNRIESIINDVLPADEEDDSSEG